MMIKPLGICESFELLKSEILSIVEDIGEDKNQIICQTMEENSEDWFTGVGSIYELEHQNEELYVHLNPKLKDTVLERTIKKYQGFRTRIMILPPRQCYSVHADPTPRIHIPIVTNTQSWMVWPTKPECHHLQETLVYWTDTTKNHTFLNGSMEPRIHLVMCVPK
jgi:hypothetical protein